MKMTRNARALVGAVIALALVLLGQQASVADTSGAHLTEAIGSEVNGEEAYLGVDEVVAFAAEGGTAVFEPGTPSEEVFSYASVDLEANRLVGLHRDAPLPHAVGAFVAPGMGDTSSAAEPAAPQEEPAEEATVGAEGRDSDGPASSDGVQPAGEDAPLEIPEPCDMIFSRSCLEVVTDTVGENPCDIGSGTGRTCDEVVDDPCGTLLGNTCLGFVIEDVIGENPCDFNSGTGRTCDDLVQQLINDPCGTLLNAPCLNWVEAVLSSLQTIACGEMDVNECTDEGIMDFPDVWDTVDPIIDSMLADDCELSIRGPWRDDEGPTAGIIVRGYGKYHCASHEHPALTIKVCLDKKVAGVWQKIECHIGHDHLLGDPHEAEARVAQGCVKSGKFRVRARGQAEDNAKIIESDSEKAVEWINCENVLD